MIKRDEFARQSSKLRTEEKIKKEEIKIKNEIALQKKLKKELLERTLPKEDLSWSDIKEYQEKEREIRFQKKIQDLEINPPTGFLLLILMKTMVQFNFIFFLYFCRNLRAK